MINYPLRWFCQRKDGRLVTNTFTGSYGTSPTLGVFYRAIFEYKVEVFVVNNLENDSYFRAECSVKEYRKSGTKQLSPIQEKVLVGISEQNLDAINKWLDQQFLQYKNDFSII